ncbi:hypothetical protein AB832_07360 [Flavobacteriaceae bacterium (ex Bugula neritina AB1)]|nr:hypothetical protein AB832_07360 [Flavobacteriaceae bacterium (ex Bugula neritina AB1)]
MAWASVEKQLSSMPEGSKYTLREELQSVYKQTGVMPEKLVNAPEMPEQLQYIVNWFCQIGSGASAYPFTYHDIKNFTDLMHIDMQPWEVEVIIKLSRVFYQKG